VSILNMVLQSCHLCVVKISKMEYQVSFVDLRSLLLCSTAVKNIFIL